MEQTEMGTRDVMNPQGIRNASFTAVIDAKGNFTFINSAFHKSLRSNVLKVLHKTFFEFIHPGDVEKIRQALAHCSLPECSSAAEIRMNGNNRWVKWKITNIGGPENFPGRFLLTGHDSLGEEQSNQCTVLKLHHYETVLEQLGVGILFQDKHGNVLAANHKMAQIFNVSLDEVCGHNTFEHLWKATEANGNPIPFEDSPPMIALRNARTQVNARADISIDGEGKRQLIINAQPLFDDDQSIPSYVISSIADISEEKKLKALCEQREALFSSFMDHSPSFAWIVDEDDTLVYANQGLLDYFGSDERALNQNISDILPGFIADAGRKKHKWVLENNLPHTSILKSTEVKGNEQIFHVTTFPAKGEGAKKMVGGQAWIITESYQAKLELKKTNERLLYLSRASHESIWDWNMQTGQIFRNDALLKLIGYHEEMPCDLSWWYNQIHPRDLKRVETKIESVLAEKEKTWELEYRFLCSDGSYKVILDRGFVVYQDNVPVRMVGSLQDVSEVKQLQTQLIREKLKKQQQIAEAILQAQEQERTRIGLELHDNVNQILFTCKLYLDLIRPKEDEEKELKDKTQEFMLLAIEEIRKLSKELVSPPLKESGLIPCINNLIDQLEIADPFNMHFTFNDEYRIESMDYNIKVTLFRIIQEQIKNIIKYSQAKNVSLQLSVKQKHVHLRIEDDGIGFDARQTRRGIGLSNIYQRTNLYNGKVNLRTQPGQGCKIKIIIPVFVY